MLAGDLDLRAAWKELDGYLPAAAAKVLIRLATAPVVRPKRELVDHLARYPEMANENVAGAVDELEARRLLTSAETGPISVLSLTSDWQRQLCEEYGWPDMNRRSLARRIGKLKPPRSWSLKDLGPVVASSQQYPSWIEAIHSAHQEVVVWTMSSAYPEVVQACQERASRGVSVRILLGAAAAVQELRGPEEAGRATRSLRLWLEAAKQNNSMEVRTVHHTIDLNGAGSTLIDGKIMRLTVYDYKREAGSQGSMIEVRAQDRAHAVNLISAYGGMLDVAWGRARQEIPAPFRSPRRLGKWIWARLQGGDLVRWTLSTVLLFCGVPILWHYFPSTRSAGALDTIYEVCKAAGGATLILAAQDILRWRNLRRAAKSR